VILTGGRAGLPARLDQRRRGSDRGGRDLRGVEAGPMSAPRRFRPLAVVLYAAFVGLLLASYISP
jgi:hypothetical protein